MDHKYLILIKKLRGDLVQRREAMMEFLALRLCAIILVTCWEYELWRQRKAARKKPGWQVAATIERYQL